ncbi:hypothetical protein LSCM1_07032 [Leishmania martiniquensis]|uniref:Uncharacterized protein n=1 Tax=Leishmania martiniquensis TaxID=1580590 RepID=A0A836KS68_9TRYP|nr:hypothetical protein LSCM1_07032 [Leishmania martiniquensis]
MLESLQPRECAAPSTAPVAISYDASVHARNACAPSSGGKKIAAGSPLSLPASASSVCWTAVNGSKSSIGAGSDAADGRGPASPSFEGAPAHIHRQAVRATRDTGDFPPAVAIATMAVPHSERDVAEHVLYDGLPQVGPASRRARQQQSEAHDRFRHRVRERTETAHALVLSANSLSLSVISSQLRMYRWRVTQAQTLTEATTIVQDLVIHAVKNGYCVRRRAPPQPRQSRYAHGRGRAALKRRAQAELERLSGVKPAAEDNTGAAADDMQRGLRAAAATRTPDDGGASDDHPAEGEEEDAELDDSDAESALPPPPPDALPRLVLVDAFTHEDLGDIARHVRFVDKEKGLELLLVLLLPSDTGAMTASMQGAGCVVRPTHHISMEDAYAAGYDLVLAHSMDHLLADFLTSSFMSSLGRWHNDVRSKAAVGNYMSLRSVLLGGLGTDALQRIVWDEQVDDAGVLEVLGAQSISTQGAAQRYSEAARNLCQQQGVAGAAEAHAKHVRSAAGNPSRHGSAESGTGLAQSPCESISLGVPRLRSRPVSVARYGVRLPAHQCASHGLLSDFTTGNDVLSNVMEVGNGQYANRRRRYSQIGGVSGSEELQQGAHDAEGLEGDAGRHPRLLQGALENELGRLLAETESKQVCIDSLQEELERLHRTVAVLRRHHPGAPGTAGDGANANTLPERPGSGSTVHLSKQQQIFILKERLEMANDRIAALLKGGRLSGAPLSPHRHGKLGGRDVGARRRGDGGAVGSPKDSGTAGSLRRGLSWLTKVTVQEAEQMAALDSDANFSLTQLELHSQEVSATANNGVSQAAAGRRQRREREAADELIHSLQLELKELQGRMDDARFRGDTAETETSDGLQARMAGRLQSALEVLEMQKAHIRHMEELRQMDQLLLKANLNPEAVKGRRRKGAGYGASRATGIACDADEVDNRDRGSSSSAGEDEGGALASTRGGARGRRARPSRSTGKRAAKSRGGAGPVAAGRKGAAGSGTGVGAPRRSAKIDADDDDGGIDSAEEEEEEVETAAAQRTEAAVKAAVHDAVASLQRVHQRQLAALLQTCRAQLSRVALKLQKPSTIAYVALLQEELARAQRDQRGAWMRLRFTLSNLDPGQYDATLAQQTAASAALGAPLGAMTVTTARDPGATGRAAAAHAGDGADMVPPGAVTDSSVRRMAADIAREYAAYGLRIAYTAGELQRVERGMAASPGQAHEAAAAPAVPSIAETPPHQLLTACQAAKARVQETVDTCAPVQEYLEAVQAELVTEQQLHPWCDVNSVALFGAMHTAPPPLSPITAASRSPPQTPSTSSMALVPSTLHLSASEPDASSSQDSNRNDAHSPAASSNHDQVVLLADVDASMRDIADVYATLLRAQTPRIGGPATSISIATSGNRNRCEAVSPTRARAQDNPNRRRQPFAAPRQAAPAASQEKPPDQSATTAVDGSPDVSNALPPLHCCAGVTLGEALDKLPVQPRDVACYQGQLSRIYVSEGFYSPAQQRLYELILRAYRQHRIHPMHMAAVECAVSLPLPGHRRSDAWIAKEDLSEPSDSASEALLDAMFAQAGAAHAQHREVVALLELLAPTMTRAIRALTKELQQAQPLLDLEDNSAVFLGAFSRMGPPCASPAFLSAVDAAVLGYIVDELRWRHAQEPSKGFPHSAALLAGGATPRESVAALMLARRRARGHSSGASAADGGAASEDARAIAHYTAFCTACERASWDARSNRGSSSPKSGDSLSSEAEDLFHLTDVPPMPSNASVGDGADAGLTVARELAALFRRYHPQDTDGAVAVLEDIYFGAGDFHSDSNAEAMRSLRRELEYLQGVKQQRMWELMMRFKLHKERCSHNAGNDSGSVSSVHAATARDDGGRSPLPPIDPERLRFEVKSGKAAWYGMEAAKRVHDILRRRARPDQIIVGGGPHGGSVGIELSRRTAQPGTSKTGSSRFDLGSSPGAASDGGAPSPEDEGYACASDDEEASYAAGPYASHQESGRRAGPTPGSTVRLPPLRQNRLLHTQHRGTTGASDAAAHRADEALRGSSYGQSDGLSGRGGNAARMEGIGYLSPRDSLSLNAYGRVTTSGAYNYSFTDQPFYTAEDLTHQVLAYREALAHAAGRALPMQFATYASGAPYCLPLSASSAPSRQVGSPANGHDDAQRHRPASPVLMPEVTSWVYGVPEGYASSLLQQQTIDSQQPPDMLLFMPRCERSELAEVERRQRARVRSAGVTPAFSRRRAFLSGAASAAFPFSTPAALAAQRLHALLSVSMADPSVATAAAAATATTAGGRSSLPTPQGCAYPLQPRRKSGASARQRPCLARPSTEPALVSVIATSAGVDDTVPSSPPDQRSAGEGEAPQPQRPSLSFAEKDPNSLEATLSPKRGASS